MATGDREVVVEGVKKLLEAPLFAALTELVDEEKILADSHEEVMQIKEEAMLITERLLEKFYDEQVLTGGVPSKFMIPIMMYLRASLKT